MKNNKNFKKKYKNQGQCYLMISTQLIGFFLFTLFPILWAFQKSFYYYNGEPLSTRFVGFENFKTLFTIDSTYWNTWLTTLKFALWKVPLELPFALIIAYFLNKKLKGSHFFRSVYFMPSVISVAIVGLIFTNLFDYFGIINGFLQNLNIISEPVDWFANKGTAMLALVLGSIWSTFGVNVLYFLSAFQNIPHELYEAAYIEGANEVTTFFKITVPMIAPVLQIIILLAINGTLQTNDYILVTTNGAPGGSTFTVMSYQVSKFVPGFAESSVNIGYGCAMSLITSVIMCAIAIVYNRISKKMSEIY